jgi:hypothetical protein
MMSRRCNTEELEALVLGKLDTETAAAVEKHSVECGACADELTWLRAEQALMARRRDAQELSPSLWEGIAARIAEPRIVATPTEAAPGQAAPENVKQRVQPARPSSPSLPSLPRRRHWSARVAFAGLITAAAAALLFVAWPHGTSQQNAGLEPRPMPHPRPRPHEKLAPDVALSNAEKEYAEALAVLEAQYKAKRGQLPPSLAKRYDSMIEQTRTRVSDARIAAGNDVDGRMLVLDGYEEYMRSLQRIVSAIR